MKIPLLIIVLLSSIFCTAQDFYLIAGTYTNEGSKGIYVYRFNAQTGKASWVSNTDSVSNPSFVIVSGNENYLYAVNETNGTNPGRVSAFSFNKNNGSVKLLNSELTGGDDPCHLALSNDNKWLVVANYTGGSVSVFPVKNDGTVEPYTQLIKDSGSGINKERQEKAHVHEAIFSPDYKYVLTPDLGIDKVIIYKFNPSLKQPLTPSDSSYIQTPAGSGPRHITFHPRKKFAYLINELTGNVIAYSYRQDRFTELQQIVTHPEDFNGAPGSAEIVVSPDGKNLYVSNRGEENTITIFSIDPLTGKLSLKGYQSTLGKAPRNFIIDPTGNYLLVANQDSDNIVIFKINKQTGLLKQTGEEIHLSRPVCLQMVRIKK